MSENPEATSPQSFGKRLVRVLPYVGVVVAIIILVSPSLVDFVSALRANSHISMLSSTVDVMPAEQKQYLLDQAIRYNARLAGMASPDDTEELLPYEKQLAADDTTMMSWVEIQSIDIQLPIYHGTEEAELSAGVGHLQMSSLPVGGASTHCVLTAHSGMDTSRMFDDIRMLETGDEFVLWTLGEPYAYEVTGSEVVEPNEMSSLGIQPGEDLCTLVTCTPYGVNSHRLLVHAKRCAYDPQVIQAGPVRVSSRNVPVYGAFALIAATVLIIVILGLWKKTLHR